MKASLGEGMHHRERTPEISIGIILLSLLLDTNPCIFRVKLYKARHNQGSCELNNSQSLQKAWRHACAGSQSGHVGYAVGTKKATRLVVSYAASE